VQKFTADKPLIELKNIHKKYGKTEALKGVNLTAKEGEFILVRGKSGAGKSTLLKIIGLLETPDEGEVRIFGNAVNGMSDDQKASLRLHYMGFIFQSFNLIQSLTVIENIELPLALNGINKHERKQRAMELLQYFNLSHLADRFPDTLSGGERQRTAIMRALANNPKIILADEPTSSLDDENSDLLIKLLHKISRERKVSVILTTTDLYEKLHTDKDYLLKDGCLHEIRF
jgi:putative ABC transport system ATP-binding protein